MESKQSLKHLVIMQCCTFGILTGLVLLYRPSHYATKAAGFAAGAGTMGLWAWMEKPPRIHKN